MHIAVVGCGHGELEKMYGALGRIEATRGIQVDLLLICGDFQAVRNQQVRFSPSSERFPGIEGWSPCQANRLAAVGKDGRVSS